LKSASFIGLWPIERGQNRVLKALSRSPIVIREILALGEDLKRGVRSI
jgi:RNA polymerase primary sigma factor